jgi:hypothetical protein
VPLAFALLLSGLAGGAPPAAAAPPEGPPDAAPRWEYRVLTHDQVIDLGKKDLAAGLNRLGDDGWELAAVDGAYIFKRPKGRRGEQVADARRRLALLEADVAGWQERVAWAQRMARKGFLSDRQLDAEELRLKLAERGLGRGPARAEAARTRAGPTGGEEGQTRGEVRQGGGAAVSQSRPGTRGRHIRPSVLLSEDGSACPGVKHS